MKNNEVKLDERELEYPETVYVRDIENRVFQALVLKAIEHIDGVFPVEGNLIGNLFNMGQAENYKGIIVEQDSKNHSVSVKIELSIAYGISIPEKASEVQVKISEELIRFTGLHVASVHVVFKSIAAPQSKKIQPQNTYPTDRAIRTEEEIEEFV